MTGMQPVLAFTTITCGRAVTRPISQHTGLSQCRQHAPRKHL